jgi:uncharacterized protein YecE (DUF72 family)
VAGRVRVGTSGWVYPHWAGRFYPEDLAESAWFRFYSQHFDTVEINNTFYHLPRETTFDGWREQAPEGFVYAVKANRYITHLKHLKDGDESLAKMLPRVRRLENHLGPILYQLPPRWRPDLERLENFLSFLPNDLVHCMEFRNTMWMVDEVFDILRKHNVGFCIISMPGMDSPVVATAKTVYLRFHGADVLYGGRYTRSQLRKWADAVRPFVDEGRDLYAYFNNDEHAYAVDNAREFRELFS